MLERVESTDEETAPQSSAAVDTPEETQPPPAEDSDGVARPSDSAREDAGTPPESFPAFEEIADPPKARRRIHAPKWLPYAVVALVLLGSAIAFVLMTRGTEEVVDTNLLFRLAQGADAFRPDVNTSEASEAADFVVEKFGWPIETPTIDGLQLMGVGEITLSETVVVPGFSFAGKGGAAATVAAYDYVFLDQVIEQFDLPPAVYATLGDDPPVDTRRLGAYYVVTWRDRAVIYTAVTDTEATYEAIGQAVR